MTGHSERFPALWLVIYSLRPIEKQSPNGRSPPADKRKLTTSWQAAGPPQIADLHAAKGRAAPMGRELPDGIIQSNSPLCARKQPSTITIWIT